MLHQVKILKTNPLLMDLNLPSRNPGSALGIVIVLPSRHQGLKSASFQCFWKSLSREDVNGFC